MIPQSDRFRVTRSALPLAATLAATLLGGAAASAATVSDATVGFLMPDQSSTRYEEHDHPGFVAEMKKLCPTCKVLYQNADGDASRQQQQFNSVVSQGAKAIVLDPVDSAAAASLVKSAQAQRHQGDRVRPARSRRRPRITTSPSTTRRSARRSRNRSCST